MARTSTVRRILTEAEIELVDMLASNSFGTITIHVSNTNQVSTVINRNGDKEQVSADEILLLQQTTPRRGEQTVARREARRSVR